MNDLGQWLRTQLDLDDGLGDADLAADTDLAKVHHLNCELSQTAGFNGPCTCGWSARMRAEVAAKRRLLDQTLKALEWADSTADSEFNSPEDFAGEFVRTLALPYADRPGYREEWRP